MKSIAHDLEQLGIQYIVSVRAIPFLYDIRSHHLPTYEHSLRVAEHAKFLGDKELGLDSALLATGAVLHDVGKICVPASILDAPDVTFGEFALIKKHVIVGYDLLEDTLPFSACIAGKHHPKYPVVDYPAALSFEDRGKVDVYVQIVTLCDFFDALMSRNTKSFARINKQDPFEVKRVLRDNFKNSELMLELLVDNKLNSYEQMH